MEVGAKSIDSISLETGPSAAETGAAAAAEIGAEAAPELRS